MLLELLGDAFGAQAAELILEMAQAEDAPRSAIIDQVSEVLLIANDAAKMQARTLLVSLAQLNHSCHERVIRDAIYALLSGNVRAEKEAAVILFTLTQSGQASPGERESTAAMIEDPSVQAVVPEPLEEQAEYREEEHPPTPPIQPVIASYFAMNNTEVPINSVFAQWVSVQLSGMSNGLTPEVRAGLLALARSRSASLLERVAAAGFLHLNDEGECKAEAASILSDLAPPVCEHRYAIAEHVRKVLRAHHALAEDLIVELENVVAQSNTSIAIDRDPMINNCNERTKAHPRRAPRKRKVDCVASEPVSNKAPRRVEDDVCAARERRGPTEAERRCVKAGREKGERDEISKKTLDEDALRVSYVTTKIGKLYPELFDLYWRAYERGNDAARQKYGTPAQRAAVLGKRYEFRSGKRSVTYPSVDDVKAQYHAEFDEAAEAEVDAHAYKAEHERAQWTPEQLADHLGKKNGGASARKGFKFSTDTSLRRWYKKRYFHATEAEVNAYVSAYKAEYSRVFLADSMM
jgi:hypothetical protein